MAPRRAFGNRTDAKSDVSITVALSSTPTRIILGALEEDKCLSRMCSGWRSQGAGASESASWRGLPAGAGTMAPIMTTRHGLRSALVALSLIAPIALAALPGQPARLLVSTNHRFLQRADGSPFFWLGDTAWLLFSRLDRSDTRRYLDDRQARGFTVIQIMVLHAADDRATNGTPALINAEPGQAVGHAGNDPSDPVAYDYWDHVDWVVERRRRAACTWHSSRRGDRS